MSESSVKEYLPKGWVIKASRSQNGKEYFCNPKRKISLWSIQEVLAFERGLKQLENTSVTSKFKPVTNSSSQESTAVAKRSSKQEALPDTTSKATCLKPQDKPFRMILKPQRKIPKSSSNLSDFIAEAASYCSSSINNVNRKTSKVSLSTCQPQASAGSDGCSEKKAAVSSSAKCPKSSDEAVLSKTSSADGHQGKRTMHSQGMQAGGSKKKLASNTGIDPTQLGSSASKLWDKLLPRQIKKRREKKQKEMINGGTTTEQDKIMTKVAEIKAKINPRIQSSDLSGASSLNNSQSSEKRRETRSTSSLNAPSPSSVEAGVAAHDESLLLPDCAVAGEVQSSTKSSQKRMRTDLVLEADSLRPADAAKEPVKKAKNTSLTRNKSPKLRKTESTPQPQPHVPSAASTTRAFETPNTPLPVPERQIPAQPTPATLKHYTIPKRARPVPAPDPPRTALCPEVADVAAAAPPLSAAADPSQCAPAAAPAAATEPATGSARTPVFGDRRWSSDVEAYHPPEATTDAVVPAPPDNDEPELMELDEPDLNEEEVLSQIACLRDGGFSPAGETGWGPDAAAVTCPGRGGEPTPPPNTCPVSAAGRVVTVVVDTNVLIHGVGFVLDLRDSFIDGARPQLLIPWVVVQELDKLKQNNKHKSSQQANVANQARAAISFLLECFQARHPGIRGQTMAEAAAARGPLESRVADDALLECCLAAAAAGDEVLLLSDDKNLLTKVLLHGLAGVSRQQLLQRTDLCGFTDDMHITEENLFCFTKVVLRKVLSYVIRRQMALVFGASWTGVEAVRRPWWSLRDLVAVLNSHRTVFRATFFRSWPRWQQLLKLATRPVLSAEEERSLCAGVPALLPLLEPTAHYLPLVRPLVELLQAGGPLSPGPLAALGPGFCWRQVAGRAAGQGGAVSPQAERQAAAGQHESVSLTSDGGRQGHELMVRAGDLEPPPVWGSGQGETAAHNGRHDSQPARVAPAATVALNLDTGTGGRYQGVAPVAMATQSHDRHMESSLSCADHGAATLQAAQAREAGGWAARLDDAAGERDGDRSVSTPPPPEDDDDAVMGSDGAAPELDSSAVLELFQNAWNYVNTCCGLLLDAAGVPHPYRYERPAAPPSPAECAAFLPELGTAVHTLTGALQRLMGVSVVSLKADDACLTTACDGLRALIALSGEEAGLAPRQLLRFIKSPANRLLLGKGLEQLNHFLRSLEQLQRLVS